MRSKSRSEILVSELGRKIAVGEYRPGDILPRVEDIGEKYKVSRTVVREAYKGLSTLGLVRSNQRSGTVVLPRSNWQYWNLEVLTWVLEDENNDDFLLHLTEIRMGLEPMAAALAAKRATEDDIRKIKQSYYELKESFGKEHAWAIADINFHENIINASYNDLLIATIRVLKKALMISRKKTIPIMNHYKESTKEYLSFEAFEIHREIYEAIENRDEETARQKMYELIGKVKKIVEMIYGYTS